MRLEDPSDAPTATWLQRLARQAAAVSLPRNIGLKASVSEFLLVSKLRARNLVGACSPAAVAEPAGAKAKAAAEAETALMMTRFAKILSVTCKDWFPPDTPSTRQAAHRRQL